MSEPTIEITQKRYLDLLKSERWLECIEGAGVDNWSGIDFAGEDMAQQDEDDPITIDTP